MPAAEAGGSAKVTSLQSVFALDWVKQRATEPAVEENHVQVAGEEQVVQAPQKAQAPQQQHAGECGLKLRAEPCVVWPLVMCKADASGSTSNLIHSRCAFYMYSPSLPSSAYVFVGSAAVEHIHCQSAARLCLSVYLYANIASHIAVTWRE